MVNNELYHFGVKGMHWGVRRYQNPDGTLTDKGKLKANKEAKKQKHLKVNEAYRAKLKQYSDAAKTEKARAREAYKSGNITKSDVKAYNAYVNTMHRNLVQNAEYEMAIGQHIVNKQYANNKAVLLKDIKGENSRQYKKAKKIADSSVSNYQNYTIFETADGSYKVRRIDIV